MVSFQVQDVYMWSMRKHTGVGTVGYLIYYSSIITEVDVL